MFDKYEYQGTLAEALAMVAALLKQGTHLSIQVLDDRAGSGTVKVRVNEFKGSRLPQPLRWFPYVPALADADPDRVVSQRAEIRALAAEAKRTGTKVRPAGRQS